MFRSPVSAHGILTEDLKELDLAKTKQKIEILKCLRVWSTGVLQKFCHCN